MQGTFATVGLNHQFLGQLKTSGFGKVATKFHGGNQAWQWSNEPGWVKSIDQPFHGEVAEGAEGGHPGDQAEDLSLGDGFVGHDD